MPATKSKFHISFFQSYLKKEILEGKQAAQICLRVADMPNDLFPINSNAGTISPIKGPDTYHGHGLFKYSIIKTLSSCNSQIAGAIPTNSILLQQLPVANRQIFYRLPEPGRP